VRPLSPRLWEERFARGNQIGNIEIFDFGFLAMARTTVPVLRIFNLVHTTRLNLIAPLVYSNILIIQSSTGQCIGSCFSIIESVGRILGAGWMRSRLAGLSDTSGGGNKRTTESAAKSFMVVVVKITR
jgi:hypothetical protein